MSRHISGHQVIALGIFLAVGAACSRGDGEAYREQVADGVLERIYQQDAPPAVDPFGVVPAARFGMGQGADAYLLERPTWLAEGPAEQLYVYDSGSCSIHRFSADGSHLGRFGGRGEGPGEFTRLRALYFLDELLVAYDGATHRFSFFTPDGTYLRSERVGTDVPGDLVVIHLIDDPSSGLIGYRVLATVMMAEARMRSMLRLGRTDSEQRMWQTLLDTTLVTADVSVGMRTYASPYTVRTQRVAGRTGCPLAWTVPETFRLDFIDPGSGDRWRTIIRKSKLPVTADLRRRALEDYSERSPGSDAGRHMRFPDALPAIGALEWDGRQRLWVAPFAVPGRESEPVLYDVFDRQGVWLFRQELPGRPGLFSSDRIYIPETLPDGSPVIRSYRLVPRPQPE